jgi:hypothetical protein
VALKPIGENAPAGTTAMAGAAVHALSTFDFVCRVLPKLLENPQRATPHKRNQSGGGHVERHP